MASNNFMRNQQTQKPQQQVLSQFSSTSSHTVFSCSQDSPSIQQNLNQPTTIYLSLQNLISTSQPNFQNERDSCQTSFVQQNLMQSISQGNTTIQNSSFLDLTNINKNSQKLSVQQSIDSLLQALNNKNNSNNYSQQSLIKIEGEVSGPPSTQIRSRASIDDTSLLKVLNQPVQKAPFNMKTQNMNQSKDSKYYKQEEQDIAILSKNPNKKQRFLSTSKTQSKSTSRLSTMTDIKQSGNNENQPPLKVRFAEEVQVNEISCRSSTDVSKDSAFNSYTNLSKPHNVKAISPERQQLSQQIESKSGNSNGSLSCSMIERIQEAKNNNKKYEKIIEEIKNKNDTTEVQEVKPQPINSSVKHVEIICEERSCESGSRMSIMNPPPHLQYIEKRALTSRESSSILRERVNNFNTLKSNSINNTLNESIKHKSFLNTQRSHRKSLELTQKFNNRMSIQQNVESSKASQQKNSSKTSYKKQFLMPRTNTAKNLVKTERQQSNSQEKKKYNSIISNNKVVAIDNQLKRTQSVPKNLSLQSTASRGHLFKSALCPSDLSNNIPQMKTSSSSHQKGKSKQRTRSETSRNKRISLNDQKENSLSIIKNDAAKLNFFTNKNDQNPQDARRDLKNIFGELQNNLNHQIKNYIISENRSQSVLETNKTPCFNNIDHSRNDQAISNQNGKIRRISIQSINLENNNNSTNEQVKSESEEININKMSLMKMSSPSMCNTDSLDTPLKDLVTPRTTDQKTEQVEDNYYVNFNKQAKNQVNIKSTLERECQLSSPNLSDTNSKLSIMRQEIEQQFGKMSLANSKNINITNFSSSLATPFCNNSKSASLQNSQIKLAKTAPLFFTQDQDHHIYNSSTQPSQPIVIFVCPHQCENCKNLQDKESNNFINTMKSRSSDPEQMESLEALILQQKEIEIKIQQILNKSNI